MSDDQSIEGARRIRDLRNRVLAGEEVAPEEYHDIIADIRQARMASAQSALRKPKSTTTRLNPDDLTPL